MANWKGQVGFRLLVVSVRDQRRSVWQGDQNYEYCCFLNGFLPIHQELLDS